MSEVDQHQGAKLQYGMLSDAAVGNIGLY